MGDLFPRLSKPAMHISLAEHLIAIQTPVHKKNAPWLRIIYPKAGGVYMAGWSWALVCGCLGTNKANFLCRHKPSAK